MGKVAFVFSGQGDQFPGMGKNFAERYSESAEVFDALDGIRPGTSRMCFEGTQEQLKQTENTQPCLFAMELAAAAALTARGIYPDAVAGFSLGEVTAATFAGIFDRDTGFRLVCRRGEEMARAAEEFDTSMAAVLRLSEAQVTELCGKYSDLYPVNFNCPGQITVSGLREQMESLALDVKRAGGRVVPLKVTGAFHSPFMTQAAAAFAAQLQKETLHPFKIPIFSNVTGEIYTEDAAGLLSRQICSPVRWETLIRNMILDGIETFVEIGPGKTLTNLIRKIDPAVKTQTAQEFLEESYAQE